MLFRGFVKHFESFFKEIGKFSEFPFKAHSPLQVDYRIRSTDRLIGMFGKRFTSLSNRLSNLEGALPPVEDRNERLISNFLTDKLRPITTYYVRSVSERTGYCFGGTEELFVLFSLASLAQR